MLKNLLNMNSPVFSSLVDIYCTHTGRDRKRRRGIDRKRWGHKFNRQGLKEKDRERQGTDTLKGAK